MGSAASAHFPSDFSVYDRAFFHDRLARLLTGWYDSLIGTSDSLAVWETGQGVKLNNFVSRSGKQCDGVTRMLPALAAWTVQRGEPTRISLTDGREIDPRHIITSALTHGTDPHHRDYWDYRPRGGRNQRQVESSLVALSLWLARDWLFDRLTKEQIANIQQWLALCTANTHHFNNWSLFTAVNHAARVALADQGFEGSLEAVRRDLLIGHDLYLADGWMWDSRYSGLDYYNFWVNGSHHAYLRAMLPDWDNPVLERALAKLDERCTDLPYLIDAGGRNVLFGRSLAYRWGWLSGLVAAHYLGRAPVDPGLTRAMLARNLDAWLGRDTLHRDGTLRERLTARGSDGGRDGYINCGHPYWGMKTFLCLAMPDEHPFWARPAQELPIDRGDFIRPRQGPGFVMRGRAATGELRLYNLRNHENHSALYQKLVYSTHFPCNADTSKHRSLFDNQFALRLADGVVVRPRVQEVDVNDGRVMHLVWSFAAGEGCLATVETTLTAEAECYHTQHLIELEGDPPGGATWVEGGFALPLAGEEQPAVGGEGDTRWALARTGDSAIASTAVEGYAAAELWPDEATWLQAEEREPNIIAGRAVHHLLRVALSAGRTTLAARHSATGDGAALIRSLGPP